MAHTLSALKRVRQNEKQRLRNRSVKSAIRTQMKKIVDLVENKKTETLAAEFKKATKMLDKAASKGVIHKNNAARHKSRLAQKIAALAATPKS